METIEIAKAILCALNANTLTVAIYPTKVESAAEFKRQAEQFAKDHEAVGIANGKIGIGIAMPLENESVPKILSNLVTAIEQLLLQFPSLTNHTSVPIKIQTLAIFTHGITDQLQASTVKNGANQWIKNSISDWAKGMASYLSPTVKILLYACNTANPYSNKLPFAENLRQLLQDQFQQYYDYNDIWVATWGHKDAGHTTANSRLIQFVGAATCEEGHDLFYTHGDWLAYYVGEELRNGSDLSEQQTKLIRDKCMRAISRIYSGRTHEGQKDPLNTYIRDIPFLGIERVWTDVVTNSTSSYNDLPVTGDTRARLLQGLQIFRERFSREWTTLCQLAI